MYDNYYYVTQAPDITEITCCGLESVLTQEKLMDIVHTEFAWVTISPRTHKRGLDALERLGFKRLTSMRNWYTGHNAEWRRLDFYWKRLREVSTDKVNAIPRTWRGGCKPNLSASGCGFAFDTPPILDQFKKFFTLVRVPLIEHQEKKHLVTLEKFNYRLVDVGSQAAFFINGWDSDKWSREVELEFFGGVDEKELTKKVVEFENNVDRGGNVAGQRVDGGMAVQPQVAGGIANNNNHWVRPRDEHGRFRAGLDNQ